MAATVETGEHVSAFEKCGDMQISEMRCWKTFILALLSNEFVENLQQQQQCIDSIAILLLYLFYFYVPHK